MPVVTDETTLRLKSLNLKEPWNRNIPLTILIRFALDNARVMLGKQVGLASLLENDVSWLTTFGCICHSFALS
jgi:hypothetical protein